MNKHLRMINKILLVDLVIVTLFSAFMAVSITITKQSDSYLLDGKGLVPGQMNEKYICEGFKRDYFCSLSELGVQVIAMIPFFMIICFVGIYKMIWYAIANYIIIAILTLYFLTRELKTTKRPQD